MEEEIPGFLVPPDDQPAQNDAPASKKTKKSGGFQAMGLSSTVLKGIVKRGYKVPTPIQRKTIPLILEGRDVVAMAKTGSGKTACFLIPLFEKLRKREIKTGARALILSPTRELAIQTFKFIKDLGRFLDLKTILVLGGDSMDSQFTAVHTLPDVIVATPGRFLHLCVEMDLKLTSVEYVVFDESDRLFEMGFAEQLSEILKRLPESKQMVMFSATLPKMLTEFARAGLSDPMLIRLDVESKIPETLELKFVFCRPDERLATLLVLLRHVVPRNAQTVVFAGTQHHVELISHVLSRAGISNTYVYSNLDPSARKINTAKFITKKVSVLVVTDVAARGIDIPSLDYVVNFHFPGKPKLFIHRVGRCARAGRQGTAFSIFSTDDEAHMLDLHLFLNRSFDDKDNSTIGVCPADLVEEEHQFVMETVKSVDTALVFKTANNAYKQYIVTRPTASVEANRRAKKIKFFALRPLDAFTTKATKQQEEDYPVAIREDFLAKMKNYRPAATIFELNPKTHATTFKVMAEKRRVHETKIQNYKRKLEEEAENGEPDEEKDHAKDEDDFFGPKTPASDDEVAATPQPKRKKKKKAPKKDTNVFKDPEHYIPYQASDKMTEDGLAINSFVREASKAEFSVIGDTAESQRFGKQLQKWDRKKKKMVNVEDPRAGKIRTEHGNWIPASYKTDRYAKWKERTKVEEQLEKEIESDDEDAAPILRRHHPHTHWGRHNAKMDLKKLRDPDLKGADQIVKRRIRLETIKQRETAAQKRNAVKRKMGAARHAKRAKAKGGKAKGGKK